MANEFSITTTTQTIPIDKQGHGEATFTVTNVTDRAIRGRAELAAEDAEATPWLTLVGEPTRDFAAAGTDSYTVHIDLQAATPAKRYAFRLDMVGVHNTDEAYTKGPSVTFQAPEPEPKPKFPWWIVAAAVGLVAVIAVVLVLVLRPKAITVPTLEAGISIAEATDALADAGIDVGEIRSVTDPDIPAGQLIGTNPPGGTEIPPGSLVDLLVSAGRETVRLPDVNDRTEADARRILEEACDPQPCLQVTIDAEPSGDTADGRVVRTDPAANTQVPVGSGVTVYLSTGPAEETADLVPTDDVYWDPVGTLYILNQPLPDFVHGLVLQLWRAASLRPQGRPSLTTEELQAAPPEVAREASEEMLNRGEVVLAPLERAEAEREFIFGPRGPGLVAIRFDMTEIPTGAEIQAAQLHMYVEGGQEEEIQILVQKATVPWSEAEATRPTCDTANQTVAPVPLAPGWNVWDVTTLAQALHADPESDYGFCVLLDRVGRRVLTSREGPANRRPFLTVLYEP